MGKHTDIVIEKLIVSLYQDGVKPKVISEQTLKPLRTVYNILVNYKKTKFINNKENRGRKPILNRKEKNLIKRELIKNPQKSTKEISIDLKEYDNINISKSSIWRTIKSIGFKSFIPRKKPFLSSKNIEKRLNYAKDFFL